MPTTPQTLLRVHAPLGAVVLLTYALCLPRAFRLPDGKRRAWGGIEGGLRTIYMISITLAAVAYLWLMRALPASDPKNAVAFQIFLGGAALWAPLVLASMHAPDSRCLKAGVVGALTLTSAGAFGLLWRAAQTAGTGAHLAAGWLAAHVFVLDNVVWAYRFVTYGGSAER